MTNTQKKTAAITVALILLMGITRSHHLGTQLHLLDASLAVFFLAGFYLSPRIFFVLFLGEAVLVDYLALLDDFGAYCMTAAYGFLLPTYGSLWLAGRWCKTRELFNLRNLAACSAVLFLSVNVAFLISNWAFYLFSNRLTEMHWLAYAQKITDYYSSYVFTALIYVVVIIGTQLLITGISRISNQAAKDYR